jgi:hypothetical protein
VGDLARYGGLDMTMKSQQFHRNPTRDTGDVAHRYWGEGGDGKTWKICTVYLDS